MLEYGYGPAASIVYHYQGLLFYLDNQQLLITARTELLVLPLGGLWKRNASRPQQLFEDIMGGLMAGAEGIQLPKNLAGASTESKQEPQGNV